jgi:flagellar protein FlaG
MSIANIGAYAAAKSMTYTASSERTSASQPSGSATTGASSKSVDQSQATKQPVSQSALNEAIKSINEFVSPVASNSIQFSIDDDTGRTIVKVIDKETDEVIRQIPNEEVIAISKALDKLQGLLVKQTA